MSNQLIALLMFLLLTYLLFRRPASAALRRLPSELHIQVSAPVYLKNESPKEKAGSAAGGSGVDRSLSWTGGAAYARYQFTPKFALAGRAEYLSDRGGLFSGVTQALKETTLTGDYKLADGFLMRGEWRRDFSNQPFFLTNAPGALKRDQNTATLGLVWWFGKEGSW